MNRKVKKIVCALASRNSSKVPTPREKTTLKANGLGEKNFVFSIIWECSRCQICLVKVLSFIQVHRYEFILKIYFNSPSYGIFVKYLA